MAAKQAKEHGNMRIIDRIALFLLVVGGINWGLVGFFRFDLVSAIFNGSAYWIARTIFAVIGLAGLYGLTFFGKFDSEDTPQPSHR